MLDFINSVFTEKFGDMVIEVKRLPMFHERWIRVIVKKKCPEMEKIAREIEKEMDELGLHVTIFIKKQRRKLGNRGRCKTVGSEAS